ncbi:hypothetical protein D047_5019A, partial [Vibrio parahaemolyticus VPTS-2010_2]
MFLSQKN